MDESSRPNEKEAYRWRRGLKPLFPNVKAENDFKVDYSCDSAVEYFKLFLNDSMITHLVNETNRYSVETTGSSIQCTFSEMCSFISITILMGICKLPSYRLYWNPSYRFEPIAKLMGLTRFETIKKCFHVNDNANAIQRGNEGYDTFFKIRPLIDHIRENCKKIEPENRQAVDEQMVKFKGRHNAKQYMPKKPIRWGYKIISRCGESGLVYNFHIIGEPWNVPKDSIGFVGDVVISLCKNLDSNGIFYLFCDRFYTSLPLLKTLKSRGIFAVGTIMQNRLRGCPLQSDKEMERGSHDQLVDANSGVTVVKWMDSKSVTLASAFCGAEPLSNCQRFVRKEHQKKSFPCPNIVKEYNRHMGGVDLHDMLKSLYSVDRKGKFFYMRLCNYLFGLCVINGWILYRRSCGKENAEMTLLQFTASVAEDLARGTTRAKRGRPTEVDKETPSKRRNKFSCTPSQQLRFDSSVMHLPHHVDKGRCKRCINGFSRWQCTSCEVRLCLTDQRNCFADFHKKK